VKSGPDWSHWKDLNHKLIRQRFDKKQSDIATKFEDLRKHIWSSDNPEPGTVTNQTLEAHQSLTQELISACYDIHCEVAADLGYEKSPAFVRTLYRRAVLPLIRELSKREDNLCHAMAALPGRQGERKPLAEIASTSASNRETEWEARIEAEATELEHSENVSQLAQESSQESALGRQMEAGRKALENFRDALDSSSETDRKRVAKILPEPMTPLRKGPLHTRVSRAPKPPSIVGGGAGYFAPKPTEVPTSFPPYFPAVLKLKMQVILATAVKEFPDRSRLEQLCKDLVSKLTDLLCTAVRDGALKAHEAPDLLNELLHYVRVANCNSGNERFEIEKAVMNSDEWRSMLERLLESQNIEPSGLPLAHSDHNANSTRRRIESFIRKLRTAGHTIKKKDIWAVAGYTDATEFERFQREDKRVTSGVTSKFNRILNMSPEVFMKELRELSPK
jgi:hypothetical protein